MGFFSDLKEDLSQAVNELMPEDEKRKAEEPTEAPEVSLDEMLKNIDEIPFPEELEAELSEGTQSEGLEPEFAAEFDAQDTGTAVQNFAGGFGAPETFGTPDADTAAGDLTGSLETPDTDTAAGDATGGLGMPEAEQETWTAAESKAAGSDDEMEKLLAEMLEEGTGSEPVSEVPEEAAQTENAEAVIENNEIENNEIEESKGEEEEMDMMEEMEYGRDREASDETSVITEGMTITGDVSTIGSIDVIGTVNGNIDALGKLNITGHVNGNSRAAEIYAESAKINGEVVSEGAVKIGASSVIIGNITATSAAIAGAVKGDIDVQGPVILDASAIVMGNIKSKSVQINNGAVIEGMCSQCYADVSPTSFFDEYKPDLPRKTKSKQGEQKDK